MNRIFKIISNLQISIITGMLLAIFAVYIFISKSHDLKVELEVQLISPKETIGAIYCDAGGGYSSKMMVSLPYSDRYKTADSTYLFKLNPPCGNSTQKLRFDPVWSDGEVLLKGVTIRTYRRFDVDVTEHGEKSINTVNSIERLEYTENGAFIKSSGRDPIVEIVPDVQSYFSYRWQDILILYVVCSIILSVVAKLTQLAVSYVLINGHRVETVRKRLETFLDECIHNTILYFSKNIINYRSINLAPYTLAWFIFGYGGGLFLDQVYPISSVSFYSGLINVQLMALIALLLLILVDLLVGWRSISWIISGVAILIACVFVADAHLFRLNGMHLNHGMTILLEGGVKNIHTNLAFTKLSPKLLMIYEVAALLIVFGVFGLSYVLNRFTSILSYRASVKIIIPCIFFALLGLLCEQKLSEKFKTPKLWAAEQADIPGYIKLIAAQDYLMKFPGGVRLNIKDAQVVSKPLTTKRLPDIYIFILESVRGDMITEEVAPNLSRFSKDYISFSKGLANGNATHYGWYSILNSRLPISWEFVKNNPAYHGSLALKMIKNLGYKLKIHSTKDLSYLGTKDIVFGGDDLVDYITPYKRGVISKRDIEVKDQLISMATSSGSDSPTFNIIFWDSTHYPYRWPSSMLDVFEPYAGSEESGVILNRARDLAINRPEMIFNRYKNSIKFTDALFGEFIDSLKRIGHLGDSLIVAVGDHGQQFMEHNYMMHGRTLFNEDIHIPLIIKLPNKGAQKRNQVASQVDIMPTILSSLGIKGDLSKLSDGRNLFDSEIGEPGFAVAAAAGYKNTPFRFVIENTSEKLAFDLEAYDPVNSRTIYVSDLLDSSDKSIVSDFTNRVETRTYVKEKFGGLIADIPFLKMGQN